ncbi:MAG: hypothetical protein BGO25_12755 [Acidobacteriales bacterium 59-55]|nr:MAG: hypothetical protein BGO25_12755 [Acidobacteriales bacterium 59-55]
MFSPVIQDWDPDGHEDGGIPQGLKPGLCKGFGRAKAEALAYPEATAKTETSNGSSEIREFFAL